MTSHSQTQRQRSIQSYHPNRVQAEAAGKRPIFRLSTTWGEIELSAGTHCAALDACLAENGERYWAVIDAADPHSFRLDTKANGIRRRQLRDVVGAADYQVLAANDGSSPVLIVGLSVERARELGRDFAQSGILVGERGQIASYVTCEGLDFSI